MTDAIRLLRVAAAMLFAAAAVHPAISCAGQPTMNECFEASDFIRNAALSRDAGVRSEAFLGRMTDDFYVIGSFPADLRWFAHDADDEAFLLAEARAVFERPASAEVHRAEFLRVCIGRMGAPGASARESP
jgi:hypothetical protein